MATDAEMIEITCPECGEEFVDWYRPGAGAAEHALCPTCGYDLASDPAAHEDGGWMLVSTDDDLRDS